MNEKVVAILAKKIKTNNGVYFLKLHKTVYDSLIDSDDYLITSEGKRYHSCYDFKFYNDEKEEHCYMYPILQSNLESIYEDDSFADCLAHYTQDLNKNMYFAALTKDEVKVSFLLQEKLKDANSDLYIKHIVSCINNNEAIVSIPESMILNLKSKIDSNNITEASTIVNNFASICDAVKEYHEKEEKTSEEEVIDIPIKDIYDKMKEEIIGQDETIKKVLGSVDIDDYAYDTQQKRRLLIIGSTGSGKTQIMRSLAKILNKPLVVVDTTQITMNGYVGGTIEENILIPLLVAAGGDIVLAQSGIVDLDEIDKKGSENNHDVSGRGVLNTLLPFLDGTTYNVKYNRSNITFDTSNLTVFATGAFTNVFDSIKGETALGFGKSKRDSNSVRIEDLIKIGGIPSEFMGRFSNISVMNTLTVTDFEKIITESKISDLAFIKEYLLNCYNVELKYDDSFITEVAKKAIDLKLGGRALKRIIDDAISVAKWEIITQNKFKELILNKDSVNDPKKYILR